MGQFTFDYFGSTVTTDRLYKFTVDNDGNINTEERAIKSVYNRPCASGRRISFIKGSSINDNALNTTIHNNCVYLPVNDIEKAVDLIRNKCNLKIKSYESKINELQRILDLIR